MVSVNIKPVAMGHAFAQSHASIAALVHLLRTEMFQVCTNGRDVVDIRARV